MTTTEVILALLLALTSGWILGDIGRRWAHWRTFRRIEKRWRERYQAWDGTWDVTVLPPRDRGDQP